MTTISITVVCRRLAAASDTSASRLANTERIARGRIMVTFYAAAQT